MIRLTVPALFVATLCLALTGCSSFSSGTSSTARAIVDSANVVNGSVRGGQQAISGASVQLYAVGTGGVGSAPTALLATPVLTDLAGTFSLNGLYTCPAPSTLVYLVATGGNPGLTASTTNAAINMVAVLGQCGGLATSTFISIDEITTVAAATALAPYFTPPSGIAANAGDGGLAQAFALAAIYADPATGVSPGVGQTTVQNANTRAVPSSQINTLADIVSACVNSSGGTAGDGSACGKLFAITGGTDVFTAIANVEANPSAYSASALFGLAPSNGPFQPVVSSAPTTFGIKLLPENNGNASANFTLYATPSPAAPGSTIIVRSDGGCPAFTSPTTISIGGGSASGGLIPSQLTIVIPAGTPIGYNYSLVTLRDGTTCSFIEEVGYGATTPSSGNGLTFSPQAVGTQSATQPVTITNTGHAAITVSSVGSSSSSYVVSNGSCATGPVAPSSTCTVNVLFHPLAAGPDSETLTIYVNGAAESNTVQVTGTGI